MYRVLGTLLNVVSLFLVSQPFIQEISKSVPLIAILLNMQVASLTAYVAALTAGLTLSISIVALAWLIYRPAISLSLLCLSGLGIYLLFFVSGGGK